MAETLTRQRSNKRGRRGKTLDPRERELKRLKLSVCDDVGFRLFLATYDQPRRRDELIVRVVTQAEAQNVRVTRLELSETGPETNLIGLLRAQIARTDLPQGWRQAVMVTGIEQRLDYTGGPEGFAFLHEANLLRDALPEAAPVPVVLWLSRMASAALPAEAPDLWHWRAANFDFTGDEAPRLELLRELTKRGPGFIVDLSRARRQARPRFLEELLIELEREGPPKSKRQAAERANLLMELGTESSRLGRSVEAIQRFERAVEAFRKSGDRRGEGTALANVGLAYADLGEARRAIAYLEQALDVYRDIGDRRNEGIALGNLGLAYADLGETRGAIEYFEQALALSREICDREGEGAALANLGLAYGDLGETRRAIEYFKRALPVPREIGDRRGEGIVLGNLGAAYAGLDEARGAIEYFEQALAIAREIGDRRGEGVVLGNLGATYAGLGETRRAIEYFEQSLAIGREIGNRRGEGNSLFNSAETFDQLGDRGEAIRRMEEALRIFEQIESPSRANARAKLAEWWGDDG